MKEPLPYARYLIEQSARERLAAEAEFDTRPNWRAAVLGGAAITILILVAAELFGALGALIAIAAPFAAMFYFDNRRN